MKMRILYVMILALALLALSACQPTGGPQTNNTPAAGPQDPGPEQAYPPVQVEPQVPAAELPYPEIEIPEVALEAEEDGAYPDIADGSSINWFKAYGLITRGEVVKVITGADGNLTLNLKDGRTLTTVMMDAQSLQTALDECTICGELEVVKE